MSRHAKRIAIDYTAPMSRRPKTVTVNDKMQRGYRYVLVAPPGRNFDSDFRPDLRGNRADAIRLDAPQLLK
jgi:hypothetical protein